MGLASAPILQLPNPELTYILRTDASDKGIKAVLMQGKKGKNFPSAIQAREQAHSVIERKCLALVWAVKKFYVYVYLFGKQFILETDHYPLVYIVFQEK